MVLPGARHYPVAMADIFDVIADGTRRDLLKVLLGQYISAESPNGEISVGQIVERMGLSQPTVSKHLKVLREAELVSVREEGQHRYYSLSTAPLDAVDDWLIPFFDDGFVQVGEGGPTTLPDSAVAAADLVGRAAASAKHAWDNALKKLPGR
jgi:DNA-binding transcriptional ArsR family regulator